MTENDQKPVPEWQLERFILGELPQTETQKIQKRLDNDALLQKQIDDLRRSTAHILATYEPPAMVEQILAAARRTRQEHEEQKTKYRNYLWGGLSLAAAASVALVVLPKIFERPTPSSGITLADAEVRIKGTTHLQIFRSRGDIKEALTDGEIAAAGDLLQISIRSDKQVYGVVVSVDGRGTVTVHYPDGVDAALFEAGELKLLPHSYELDDAPAIERFFFVSSKQRFSISLIQDAAKNLGRSIIDLNDRKHLLSLPSHFEQTTFIVKKGNTL